jgi:alcohol dehydrogenase class IV
MDELVRRKFVVHHIKIGHEPSPAMIDSAVASCSERSPQVVIGLGGGSVLDAGKAIAAMIPLGESVTHYLEGVGTRQHPGVRLPFIALPTTSGTGSEATRNAVISEVGEQGFKRSLRHMNFVADSAILDPALTIHCPPNVTAYSGMDAFTQLLESYLSNAASPITDALAWQGLKLVARSLTVAYCDGMNVQARLDMALAAYLSGITLANAGLGTVHGMAGVIGGLKSIPHGIICSRLMGPANAITIRRLRNSTDGATALAKYANIGKMFTTASHTSDSYYVDALIDIINKWTLDMHIPGLAQYDVADSDLRRFAQLSDNKNNPVVLSEDERYELLHLASK